jgi:acetyl esterase
MRIYFTLLYLGIIGSAFPQNGLPTAAQIRESISGEIHSFKIPPQSVHKVVNTAVWNGSDSIKVRLYFPQAGKNKRIIYNIHGGALVAGDLDTHDNICRVLASKTSSIVVAVDYRKPPEAPYPAGLDDCISVLNWIRKTASSWGGDPANLVLLGDSGGGLLITAMEVKMQGKIPVKKIALINPAVDLRTPGEGLYGLVTQMYLSGKSANDSLVSPILATNVSYFPPSLIITCANDLLKPQGMQWHEKLRRAQVAAKLTDIPNQDHLGGYWAAAHPDAQQAINETVKFITTGPIK